MKKNMKNSQVIELPEWNAEQSVQVINTNESQVNPRKKGTKPLLTESEVLKICFDWLDKIYGDTATQACVEQMVPGYQYLSVEISFEIKGLSLKTNRPMEDSKSWRVCKRLDVNTKTGEVDFMKNVDRS
ncbi:hypothetical protein WBG78_28990 [Chryseolinea sp. T2]|uniref:hypothetical protein n=1 Tax=Chryseolinea sp. T2 TaxID=3129255 RepID=UPI0030771C85